MEIKGDDFIKSVQIRNERKEIERKLKDLEEHTFNKDYKDNYELKDIPLDKPINRVEFTRSSIADWTTIFFGIIAILNFIYSLIHGTSSEPVKFPNGPEFSLVFQFILFIIIESILAYIFGRILIRLELIGRGIPIILLWLIAIISVWTSMFNVQWLLTGPITNELINSFNVLGLIFSMVIALIIAIYLIFSYVDSLSISEQLQLKKHRLSVWVQIISYFAVFVIHLALISNIK